MNAAFENGVITWDVTHFSDYVAASGKVGLVADGKVSFYNTIADAIDAMSSVTSGTITLLDNMTESVTIPTGKTVLLELNGKTLTNNAGSHTITVTLGSNLTVQDSVGGGLVDNVSHARAAILNNGTATLNGGKYDRSKENGQNSENAGGNSYYAIVNHGTMTIQKPESEQILVENTHEPLISMEVWEIVQDVRAHKRRPPKHMEEPNLFSGLVYCADCGKYMVLCRTEKMREDQYYFRCSTYSKRGKTACSPHQIREADLKAIVLDDLRRVTHFARMKERQFAQYINQRNTVELRREINRLQKDLDSMHRRYDELSALFKRLYEDNVLGRVSDEQFRMLSADYNAEQKNLSADIPAKEEQLEKLKASAANVDAFIEKAKRYTTIDELTPELLRLFIQRIEVGERSQKYSRSAGQSVKIVYRDIGRVDSPMQEGEHAPHITKQITDIEEIKRLLA